MLTVLTSLADVAGMEATSAGILNVSIKINDHTKDLPLRLGPEPIFVQIENNDVNSFVETSVYLETQANTKLTISSDMKNFIATIDGAKKIEGKNGVTFVAQKERLQLYAYGNIPDKNLLTILRITGDSDLLNILARQSIQAAESASSTQVSQSAKDIPRHPLTNPVLNKLNGVINNSTLPNKDHYMLVAQDIEKIFKDGKEDQAISRALSLIDEIQNQEKIYSNNKRDCELSRLKILEAEDQLTKADLPKEIMNDALNELTHAKEYQKAALCQEALRSAHKAAQSAELDPFTWITTVYPWLIPAIILVGLGFVGLIAVQRYRAATLIGGLR